MQVPHRQPRPLYPCKETHKRRDSLIGSTNPILLNANASKIYFLDAKSGLTFSDEPVVTPDAPKLKRFNIRAYTGGAVTLPTLPHPVVFDLATMQTAPQVPLLWSHDHNTVVGHNDSVSINRGPQNWGVDTTGLVSGTGYRAKEVAANADNKYPWQVSVGLITDNLVFYKNGETFQANGQTFTGPKFHALTPLLREVSFTAIGADPNTTATLAASAAINGSSLMMTFEQFCAMLQIDPTTVTPDQKTVLQKALDAWNKEDAAEGDTQTPPVVPANAAGQVPPVAPVQANARGVTTLNANAGSLIGSNLADFQRQTTIRQLETNPRYRGVRFAATEPAYTLQANGVTQSFPLANSPIIDAGIALGWTPEQTEIHLLRASRNVNVVVPGNGYEGPGRMTVLEAAVSQSVRHANVERSYTPQVLEAAHRQFRRGIGLQELLLEAAVVNGYTGSRSFRGNHRAILEAAFSTIDIGGILSNVVNKSLLEGAQTVDDSWRQIASVNSVKDFKATANYRGVGYFTFEQLAPDQRLPHGKLTEENYANQADTYGKMFAVTRKDQINDDLNVVGTIPRQIGRGGMLKLVKVFWTEFMDNSTFFASGNSNITTGVFGIAGLSTADAKFRKQVDGAGEYIMGTPKVLLVPAPLKLAADVLVGSVKLSAAGNTTPIGEDNPMSGKYTVVSTPYLDDANFTGYSAVAYYLLADPKDVPVIEVVFLDGVETPTVETAEVDFSQLGIQMRGYFDFGCALQDFRGGVRSTGA